MRDLRHIQGPAPFPWRRPRGELLVLTLVAVVALSPVYLPNTQDTSHVCLSLAAVSGRLSYDSCFLRTIDRSRYHGHLYSDKAPGMSVLEIAPVEAVRLPGPERWAVKGDLRLWLVRLFASGIPFLLCVFLVGRISEGLAPGFGALSMVAFGLGSLLAPLAASGFDHVPTACFGFLAFVLSWRRRPLAAGLAAGAALAAEYEAAAVLLIVAAYVGLQGGRALARYAAGAVPGAALLAAYSWAAFGAPWRNPHHYEDNRYQAAMRSGVLGVHFPSLHGVRVVFTGDRGLLITSPVLVAAAAGLVLVWRRGLRAEALTCAAVTATFVIAECGYFDPYGGESPGARFLVPALPFLALGLGPLFARRPVATTVLAAASIVATTAVTLTWTIAGTYRQTIWGELVRTIAHPGTSALSIAFTKDVLTWQASRLVGAAVLGLLAVATLAVAMGASPMAAGQLARLRRR